MMMDDGFQLPFVPGGLRSLLAIPLDPSLNPSDTRIERGNTIVDLLELYFCNKEMKSILAQAKQYTLPGSKESFGAWVSGWVPLAMIASFKTVKAAKVSTNDLIDVIQHVCPSAFEISNDGSCIRRVVSFDQPSSQERIEALTRSTSLGLLLEVIGFEPDVTKLEIKEMFESCGLIKDVSIGLGGEGGNEHVALIDFVSPEGIVKALSGFHVYEETSLRLRAKSKLFIKDPLAVSRSVGNHLPSLHSVSGKTEPLKLKGQAAVQSAAILGYPFNRVLKVGPIPEDMRMRTSLLTQAIEKILSNYGPIAEVVLEEGSLDLHARFKTPIAAEVEGFLKATGGVEVHGEVLPAVALKGEEERIFYEVLKLRTPASAMDVIPLQSEPSPKKAKAKKQPQRQTALRRSSRTSKKKIETILKKERTKAARRMDEDVDMSGTAVNENNKRPAESGDGLDELCDIMSAPLGRPVAKAKRVKVEHVDSLFKNLKTTS
ncbi:hypothetical protein BC829DRAFT_233814 [Chytridium lagenaria]|nr:hypothetical protein BC829DRAFT_233814 [Chytridium lagenaria]